VISLPKSFLVKSVRDILLPTFGEYCTNL